MILVYVVLWEDSLRWLPPLTGRQPLSTGFVSWSSNHRALLQVDHTRTRWARIRLSSWQHQTYTTRHYQTCTRHHQTCTRHHQTWPRHQQTLPDMTRHAPDITILEPSAFQKYSTCWVFSILCLCLCLCIGGHRIWAKGHCTLYIYIYINTGTLEFLASLYLSLSLSSLGVFQQIYGLIGWHWSCNDL